MYEGTSIYVQDITTGKVRELTSGILPTWSPDGSQLAFLSAHTGTPEVWTIHADGTDLQQITDDGTGKSFSLTWIGQGEVNK
jgi:Tol biopolymer transport system component